MIVFCYQLSNRVIPAKAGIWFAYRMGSTRRRPPISPYVSWFFSKKRVRDSSFRWNDAVAGLSDQQIPETHRSTVIVPKNYALSYGFGNVSRDSRT
jgi:hypothetical protein